MKLLRCRCERVAPLAGRTKCPIDSALPAAYAPSRMSGMIGVRARRRGVVQAGAAVAAGFGLSGVGLPAGVARAQETPPSDDGGAPAQGPQVPRPIIVQIDNDPRARPSSNLGAASYVYEYTAEG